MQPSVPEKLQSQWVSRIVSFTNIFQSFIATKLYSLDTTLKRTAGAGPDGICMRDYWVYSTLMKQDLVWLVNSGEISLMENFFSSREALERVHSCHAENRDFRANVHKNQKYLGNTWKIV